jgi:glycerophosphoryl diester phosphodiesterase
VVRRPRIAAHRGGAALWPENSLLAVRQALALGVGLVEIDVHLAADGALAVIHDRTLERTTDGAGAVAGHTGEALRRRRLTGPDGRPTDERVPMLDDVLALLAPSPADLLLEIKSPGGPALHERAGGRVRAIPGPRYEELEARVLSALEARGVVDRTTVLAFNPAVLERLRSLAPRVARTLVVAGRQVEALEASAEEMLECALAAGATDIGLEHTLVDDKLVAAARAAGLRVGAWTVNEARDMRRLAALGIDIITTDRPDLAVRVLAHER